MTDVLELEIRLNKVLESLEEERKDFEDGAKLCVEAIHGVHQRLERIEKWMLKHSEEEKAQRPPIKTRTTVELNKIQRKPSNPWKNR